MKKVTKEDIEKAVQEVYFRNLNNSERKIKFIATEEQYKYLLQIFKEEVNRQIINETTDYTKED